MKLPLILAAACTLAACAAPNRQPVSESPIMSTASATHSVSSAYPFADTVARLQNAVRAKGMTVFAVIDHQAAAKQAGLSMQPATVIIFGTPKAGTPLMVQSPDFALQLPLRVLVTETDGQVCVVFNDTAKLIEGSGIAYSQVENTLANAEKLIRATISAQP